MPFNFVDQSVEFRESKGIREIKTPAKISRVQYLPTWPILTHIFEEQFAADDPESIDS